MKRTHSLGKFKTIQALLLVLLMFAIFLSCKKERNNVQQETKIRSQKVVLIDWGQAANGRWIPYLLDKVKRENPQSDAKGVTDKFFSYLNVVVQSKMSYRRELLTQMGVNAGRRPRFLDSLYRANYTAINGSLAERDVMDSLWVQYQAMFDNESGGINQITPLARSANDPPEATSCAIPGILQGYFIDFLSLPNRYNTPIIELLDMMNPEIVGCRKAYATQISALVGDMMYQVNPDLGTCHIYQMQIEEAFYQWISCPLIIDPGGGAGGGSGGGGTSPGDPYPPVDPQDPETDSLLCTELLAKINGDIVRPGYNIAINQARQHIFDTKEWGSAIWLSNYNEMSTAFTGNAHSSNEESEWINTFTWNASQQKYQVSTVHTHPEGYPPSPNDVLTLARGMNALEGKASAEQFSYFTNASVIIVGPTTDWIVTADNWNTLWAYFLQETTNMGYLNSRFAAFRLQTGDDAMALLATFTDDSTGERGIRLYRSSAGANSFNPYRLVNGNIVTVCQ